jgi:hypothetical protein
MAKRPRAYLQSGHYAAERALSRGVALPGPDTAVGAVLAERRASLISDLGGDPSTAQLALVDLAVRSWALLDATDAHLVALPSPVDRRHRRLWPVVLDRLRVAAQLEATLCRLGLERRVRDVDLTAELARREHHAVT